MLKAETIITCPSCEEPQLKSTKDLLPGSKMMDAEWVSLGYDMKSPGAECFKCEVRFVRKHPKTKELQFHTKDRGWVSLTKKPSTPSKSKIIS